MRLLVVADIHGARGAREWILAQAKEFSVDGLVVCGDISNFGPLGYIEGFLQELPRPCIAVPGNCDPRNSVALLERLGVNLHGKRRDFLGAPFVGLGGSNPTPFGTPFELEEDDIHRQLEALMDYEVVLVTHAPPRGHVDVIPRTGAKVGSTAVAEIVDDYGPKLVLCGHIHEARGTEMGATTFVNPGPAKDGFSALVEYGEGATRVELLDRGPQRL